MAITLPPITTLIFYAVVSIVLYYSYRLLDSLVIQPYRRYTVLKRQIPSTPFIPLLGDLWTLQHYARSNQLLTLGKDITGKYGSVMHFMLGPFNVVQVVDPDYVLAIWKTMHSHYFKGHLAKSMLGPLLGELSMVLIDEPTHGKNRKMVAPAFHYAKLQDMVTIMVDETNRIIDQLLIEASCGSTGSTTNGSSSSVGEAGKLEVHKWFTNLALNIIMQSSFGNSLQHIPDAQAIIYNALTTVLTLLQTRSLTMVGNIRQW